MFFKVTENKILVHKDMRADDVRLLASELITSEASLSELSDLVDQDVVFVTGGIITVGVPLGTDDFVSKYVVQQKSTNRR